ncbi:MAG: hypothetical protein ACI814_003015 [Mariniblastus sp.]|jgi:hypothetical protein
MCPAAILVVFHFTPRSNAQIWVAGPVSDSKGELALTFCRFYDLKTHFLSFENINYSLKTSIFHLLDHSCHSLGDCLWWYLDLGSTRCIGNHGSGKVVHLDCDSKLLGYDAAGLA